MFIETVGKYKSEFIHGEILVDFDFKLSIRRRKKQPIYKCTYVPKKDKSKKDMDASL